VRPREVKENSTRSAIGDKRKATSKTATKRQNKDGCSLTTGTTTTWRG
jgi:hypothetical protein